MKLLLATKNQGKLAELQVLFRDLPLELVLLGQVGITQEVPETGATFAVNARIKALAYAQLSGLLALADDSGLEIDALDGEPGVHSARFCGENASYAERFAVIFERLRETPDPQRTARFRCAIAIASPGKLIGIVEGVCEGSITHEPRGSGGFGYDPIFFYPPLQQTLAQVNAAQKHAVSHRGQAARAAHVLLKQLLHSTGKEQR